LERAVICHGNKAVPVVLFTPGIVPSGAQEVGKLCEHLLDGPAVDYDRVQWLHMDNAPHYNTSIPGKYAGPDYLPSTLVVGPVAAGLPLHIRPGPFVTTQPVGNHPGVSDSWDNRLGWRPTAGRGLHQDDNRIRALVKEVDANRTDFDQWHDNDFLSKHDALTALLKTATKLPLTKEMTRDSRHLTYLNCQQWRAIMAVSYGGPGPKGTVACAALTRWHWSPATSGEK
jgi:hypothetical protein